MKKIFTLSVLASLAFSSYAGEVVYQSALDTSEEFAKWTVIDANSDTKTWGFDESTSAAKYGYGTVVADDWLISPAVNVKAGAYMLTFDYQGSSYGEKMDVFYGNSPEAASMTESIIDLGTFDINGEFAQVKQIVKVDNDGTIHIGFHAKSDPDKFRIFVKNVSLATANGLDAAVLSVKTSESADNLSNEPVTITVRNNSIGDISNLPVYFQANNQPAVSETIEQVIKPGETVEYTFKTLADLNETGSYTITAWAALENDEIPENDRCSTSTRHFGPASVPYVNGFEDEYSRSAIKYFDLNEDPEDEENGSWSAFKNEGWFGSYSRNGDYSMIYWYSKNHPGDDWFILEPIRLKAGYYSLKFWYASMGDHNERFAVYYGTESTPEGMKNQIVSYDPFQSDSYIESASVFHIEQDGIYYIGFHSFSDPDENIICIDDLSIEEIPSTLTDLTVGNVLSPANGYVRPLQTQDVIFTVVNNSIVDVENTSVEIAIDGTTVNQFTIDKMLAQETKTFDYNSGLADLAEGDHKITITVKNDNDQVAENNVYEADFKVLKEASVMYDFENGGKLPEDLIVKAEDGATVHEGIADIFPNNEAWAPVEIYESETYGSWLLGAGSWFTDDTQADRWCIFPKMKVNSENADMVWTANSGDMGKKYPETYEIRVSTTDTETGSFSEIATITNENYADMPSTRGVDLGAYNGQEIYVAFRLITRDGYMLTIDNVGFYGDIEKAGQSGVENISDNAAITVDNNWVRCTAEKVESISVYDASGRIVAQNSNNSSLSIDNLSNGVYIVRAIADGKTLQRKFIK